MGSMILCYWAPLISYFKHNAVQYLIPPTGCMLHHQEYHMQHHTAIFELLRGQDWVCLPLKN